MKVHVQLFARAKELVKAPAVDVELTAAATVAALRRCLAVKYPALQGLVERCAIAVNEELAGDDVALAGGATVALLPPVSGGQ